MTDHPILFQGDMILAILDGRKTQTRRVIKLNAPTLPNTESRLSSDSVLQFRCPPENMVWRDMFWGNDRGPKNRHCKPIKCPHGVPGDLLWARETLIRWCESMGIDHPYYKADETPVVPNRDYINLYEGLRQPWCWKRNTRPSIFMPKWACRLWLKVKSVRVEQLQEISREDAIAEGVDLDEHDITCMGDCANRHCDKIGDQTLCDIYHTDEDCPETEAFGMLWDSINAKPKPRYAKKEITHYESYPWEDIRETREHRGKPWHVYGNPHVFATEFERYEQ